MPVMTPQIRALLVAVAILGGGVVIWTAAPGVTLQDLQNAGIGACATRERDCTVRDEPGGVDICPGGQRYCRKTIALKVCNEADGGKAVIMRPAHVTKIAQDSTWCGPVRASALSEGATQDVPFDCACAQSAACKLTDGGAAPFGLTMQPGTFQPGAACIGKSCIALAQYDGGRPWDETWPTGCPQ